MLIIRCVTRRVECVPKVTQKNVQMSTLKMMVVSLGWAQYCNRHETAEEVASFTRMNKFNAITYQSDRDKPGRPGGQQEERNCIRVRPSKVLRILRRTLSITMCGCGRIQSSQGMLTTYYVVLILQNIFTMFVCYKKRSDLASAFRKKLPVDQHDYIKDVSQRAHHNCHFEK